MSNVTKNVELITRMRRDASTWEELATRALMRGNDVATYNRYMEKCNRIRFAIKSIQKNTEGSY